jgi:predicted N-acyltransferase
MTVLDLASPIPAIRPAAAPAGLDIRVATTLAEVPRAAWDAVAGGSVVTCHDTLLAVEEGYAGAIEPHYVLASRDGVLRGAAVCYYRRAGGMSAAPDHLLLGALHPVARRLGLSFLPVLACGGYRANHSGILGSEPAAVLDAVEALARRLGVGVLIERVTPAEPRLRDLLRARGYHGTLNHPVAWLDIGWRSFDGYVESLRRINRQLPSNTRREMAAFRRAGLEIRPLDDLEPVATRLHGLADALSRRRNGSGLPYGPALLARLKARLGERCLVYGAFADDRLVGFTMFLRDRHVGYGVHVGVEPRPRGERAYFNLNYYRPIADAIAAGLERLDYGTLLYQAKVHRGCRVVPTELYWRGASRASHALMAPWFRAHRQWAERRKFAAILALGPRHDQDVGR